MMGRILRATRAVHSVSRVRHKPQMFKRRKMWLIYTPEGQPVYSTLATSELKSLDKAPPPSVGVLPSGFQCLPIWIGIQKWKRDVAA